MSSPQKIELIPWDHTSGEHAERMYAQRLACGWRSDEVQKWRDLTAKGTKMLYWAVLGDGMPNKDELLSKHIVKYPKESTPIHDTASTHWLLPRPETARRAPFVPIGHVALDFRSEENARLGVAEPGVRIVWIAGLYISWALQSGGVGRAVMAAAEALAPTLPAASPAPPAGGEQQQQQRVAVVLDTMPRDQQMRADFIEKVYLAQGNPAPAVSSEDWYRRQGYVPFSLDRGAYLWRNPMTGDEEPFDILYFKKIIV
ncbi:hypothetical protein NKR23_g9851 [Pleurostoma richardsiae]|uniref:Uncharacterized protein n=1 Tax=Pleurostoma richardsiae TaxID=41990 RepID=A0AA38R402_9PEZI|nr:hypothetical protein NKR23_g9851 [Pleurostoma richardsiae]